MRIFDCRWPLWSMMTPESYITPFGESKWAFGNAFPCVIVLFASHRFPWATEKSVLPIESHLLSHSTGVTLVSALYRVFCFAIGDTVVAAFLVWALSSQIVVGKHLHGWFVYFIRRKIQLMCQLELPQSVFCVYVNSSDFALLRNEEIRHSRCGCVCRSCIPFLPRLTYQVDDNFNGSFTFFVIRRNGH